MARVVPVVEVADHRHRPRVGCPDGKTRLLGVQVAAQQAVQTRVRAFTEEEHILLADQRQPGRSLGTRRALGTGFRRGDSTLFLARCQCHRLPSSLPSRSSSSRDIDTAWTTLCIDTNIPRFEPRAGSCDGGGQCVKRHVPVPSPSITGELSMTASAESLGMCSTRLKRIDRFLAERYVEPGRLPCAQLLVARDGQIVHQSVLGKASLESGAPLREDSLVRIYSMTKPITSVAFMMLVEQGLVALDDPVHRYIPSWRDLGVYIAGGNGLPGTPPGWQTRPTDAPMRIIDLLRHTSGLTYGFQSRTNVDAAYRANNIDPFAQGEGSGGLHRVAVEGAAGVFARQLLELLGLDRRARLPDRQDLRSAFRRVPAPPHLPAAGHGGHRVPCRRRQGRAAGRVLRQRPRRQAGAADHAGRLPHRRRPRPPAAAGWCPPPPTTCAFANACAVAARWATCA